MFSIRTCLQWSNTISRGRVCPGARLSHQLSPRPSITPPPVITIFSAFLRADQRLPPAYRERPPSPENPRDPDSPRASSPLAIFQRDPALKHHRRTHKLRRIGQNAPFRLRAWRSHRSPPESRLCPSSLHRPWPHTPAPYKPSPPPRFLSQQPEKQLPQSIRHHKTIHASSLHFHNNISIPHH